MNLKIFVSIIALILIAPSVGFTQESELKGIEQLFSQIEATEAIEDKDKLADELEARMAEYAKALFESVTKALEDGSAEQLNALERSLKTDENILMELEIRAEKSGSISEPAEGRKFAGGWPLLGTIGAFIISPAQAEIAGILFQAHVTAIADTAAAWVTFNACWDALDGVRPKWLRAFRRLRCVAALVRRLA